MSGWQTLLGTPLDFKYQNEPTRLVLAIAGGKGGCGKTTTALGLATALARNGTTPTVVDADRDSPDVHLLADTPFPNRAERGNCRDELLASVLSETSFGPGVSVVPAPSRTVPDNRFRAALDRFANEDWPVLVDCPAGAGRDAVAPLRASDEVLLATTLSPASLRDAAKTAAMADRLGIEIAGTVLTKVPTWASRADGRGGRNSSHTHSLAGGVRSEIVRRVERLLDISVIGQVPEVKCSDRAVFEHAGVRAAYDRLAESLRG